MENDFPEGYDAPEIVPDNIRTLLSDTEFPHVPDRARIIFGKFTLLIVKTYGTAARFRATTPTIDGLLSKTMVAGPVTRLGK